MKTPRQILFEQHRSVEPKLDALRQSALAGMVEKPAQESVRPTSVSLREIVLSLRWHWAGLSAVWLLIALFKFNSGSIPPTAMAAGKPTSPQELLTSLRENRRQLLELMGPSVAESPEVPRRRSERQPLIRMV